MQCRSRIELLGGLRVVHDDRAIEWFGTRKAGALLGYLAYHSERSHAREVLAELLWPECEPEACRHSLSSALSLLRHHLRRAGIDPHAVIAADRTAVSLNTDAVTTDVAEFREALQQAATAHGTPAEARHLSRAAALYRGELLRGYLLDWLPAERDRLAELCGQALCRLVDCLAAQGDLDQAWEHARRAVALDPLREEACLCLMRLSVTAGYPSAALRQYRELERLLQEELGAVPSAALQDLAREIQRSGARERGDRPATDGSLASRASLPLPGRGAVFQAPATNLPRPLTRFFGREEECARVCELLRAEGTALVTLTGAPGSGKTRLALKVAELLLSALEGALWFVPLADLARPEQFMDAVVAALRLPPSASESPMDRAAGVFMRQRCLLLLDNFEHLVAPGAPLVRELLERAPTLTCLVTSRRHLGLEGEIEVPVMPLPIPQRSVKSSVLSVEPDDPPRVPSTLPPQHSTLNTQHLTQTLMQFPSVQLFVDRARAVRPDFQPSDATARAVAELCEKLEGIPLAIELAAAWTQVLTPTQMVGRLDRRLDFPASRRSDVVTRHRTLRATLDWSHGLLPSELQRFFARLAVFRGGWTLEAAEAVCGEGYRVETDATAGALHPTPYTLYLDAVLGGLAQLRACSLVLAEEQAHRMRYRMLELSREYAAEQLAAGERAVLERRHAEYYLSLAEQSSRAHPEPWPTLRQTQEWVDRLESERDNLRAALAWGDENEPELALRLAVALRPCMWRMGGPVAEAREVLVRAARGAPEAPAPLRAKALWLAARAAQSQTDYPAVKALAEECLALARPCGDTRSIGEALRILGYAAVFEGDVATAEALGQESLAIWRALGDHAGIAHDIRRLGTVAARRGDHQTARRLYEESLEVSRRVGHESLIATALDILGQLDFTEGDDASARARLEESLAMQRAYGQEWGGTPMYLARVACRQGEYTEARALIEESLAICVPRGDKRVILGCLEGLAEVVGAVGEPERAARLLGAVSALRTAIGQPRSARGQATYDRLVTFLCAVLTPSAFAAAQGAGQRLTWQEAVECALEP